MRGGSRGYTLVALMIGLTIMTVLIAAVMPIASTEAQREKEKELVFRGLQYAEGIRTFRAKYGRYPTSLKEMLDVRPRTLRKLWKDPITDSTDWGLISLGNTGVPVTTPTPGPGGPNKSGSGSFSPTPVPTSTESKNGGSGSGFGGGPGGPGSPPAPLGPVMGVYSKSHKKSIRIYEGRDEYDQWRFTEQSLAFQGASPGPGGGSGLPPPPGGPKK